MTEGAQQQPSAAAAGHPDPEQAAGQLRQAGQLVGEAVTAMDFAALGLGTGAEEKEADFRSIVEHQQTALQKLAEALKQLDDQQDQNQNQNQDQQQDQQQQESDEQQQQRQQQQNLDTNQLLQLIRDREAQRRMERQRVQAAASGTVDKDW